MCNWPPAHPCACQGAALPARQSLAVPARSAPLRFLRAIHGLPGYLQVRRLHGRTARLRPAPAPRARKSDLTDKKVGVLFFPFFLSSIGRSVGRRQSEKCPDSCRKILIRGCPFFWLLLPSMACLAICKFVDCAVGLRGFGQHPRRAQNFRGSFSSTPIFYSRRLVGKF